jgi:hypothetical protein
MRLRKRTVALLLALAVPGAGNALAQSALIRDSNPPDVALVFTGDVIGYLDPCG